MRIRASDTQVDGGLGNDEITGFKGDAVDGGLGQNECRGGRQVRCNENSPGESDGRHPILDIGPEGVLTVIGSSLADDIDVGYDAAAGGLPDQHESPGRAVEGLPPGYFERRQQLRLPGRQLDRSAPAR